MKTNWRLPRGVDELLPPAAWQLEKLRRAVLDTFVGWGFEYVEPPIIEYLESLLVGSGEDLDLQTLKVMDQVSGKQLGVRADMTSQAIRIDAHSLIKDGVQRLCYAGPVVFASPVIAQNSRVPTKAGAEIFGAASLDADAEVIGLMLETMRVARVQSPVLLLGHMGIYRCLAEALITAGALSENAEQELFRRVQRKSQADIRALLDDSELADMMVCLPLFMGGVSMLDDARQRLSNAPSGVLGAIDELQRLTTMVADLHELQNVRLDLSELSGYGYHNGPVFAVYHPQHGSALAQGGRYDGVGEAFGRARPATGFDVDLKNLIGQEAVRDVIFAPWVASNVRADLGRAVALLRQQGERVCYALAETETPGADIQRVMVLVDEQWQVIPTDRSIDTSQ